MKAIIFKNYNGLKSLHLKELDRSEPNSNEVLIKVKASSINSWDYDLVTGTPKIYRLMFGLFKPKYQIPGIDVAGVVEAVGKNVTRLKLGDEVFGDVSDSGFGAFAEYTCCKENLLAIKPKNLSFEDAAALPHAGTLAYQSMLQAEPIKTGIHVLINGAGGCVGPYLLQFAKQKGATVTVVDKPDKFTMLKELGADYFIDYTQDDFTKGEVKYDFILELLMKRPLRNYLRSLNPKGMVSVVGGTPGRLIKVALLGSFLKILTSKHIRIMAHRPNYSVLDTLAQMTLSGMLHTKINYTFPLSKVPEAIEMIGKGKLVGKAVIKID